MTDSLAFWYAEYDREAPEGYPWRPNLQLDGYCCDFDIWFATEAECLDFIKTKVMTATLDESP